MSLMIQFRLCIGPWQTGKLVKISILSMSPEVLTQNRFEQVQFFLNSGKQNKHLFLLKEGGHLSYSFNNCNSQSQFQLISVLNLTLE